MKTNQGALPIQRCLSGEEVGCLQDNELLAIVLGSGARTMPVLDLAAAIMRRYGSLGQLYRAGIRELSGIHGIGGCKAVKIHAALEMGKRLIGADDKTPQTIDSPLRVWQLLLPEIITREQEEFHVLLLDNKNRLIKKKTVFRGTVSEALIHPREIFRDAVRESASAIIVAHNHPSGVLVPSDEDITATRRMVQAGEIMGIRLLDHVILGERAYLSLKEEGYLSISPHSPGR